MISMSNYVSNLPPSSQQSKASCFLHETVRTSLEIESPPIFPVSARQGLRARLHGEENTWRQSGAAALEQALLDFAMNGKQRTLTEAVQRKAINLVARTDQLLALEQRAMELPLEALEQKLTRFKQYASTAVQQRQEIIDRLRGDETRLVQELETAVVSLRKAAQTELMRLAEAKGLPTDDETKVDSFHQAVREYFDRKRTTLGSQFREALNNVLVERAHRAQVIRENLRREAASLLEVSHFPLLAEDVMVRLQEPAWKIERLTMSARPESAGWWVPQKEREQRYARQREKLVNELVILNAEKVRWWILHTIQESMSAFRQRIALEVEKTIQQIDHALQAGLAQRYSQEEVQHKALARLAVYRHQLGKIRQEIENYEEIKEGTREPTM